MEKKDSLEQTSELHRQAEDIFKKQIGEHHLYNINLSPEEIRRMIHELQVHQIELEIQNDELRQTQVELNVARARYFDLYDLLPVGYLTVSEKGLIIEGNITASTMLGTASSLLVGQPLSLYIFSEDQNKYYLHRKECFATGQPTVCELRILRSDGSHFWVHLNMKSAFVYNQGDSQVCLVVIGDLTEHLRLQEIAKEKEMAEIALAETEKLKRQLKAEREFLQEEIRLEHNYQNIIGQSDAIKSVLYKIEQIARTDTTVLVLGETGTGKELVARRIHDLGRRKNRPLIKVSCAALPSNLIENELFGHEKGAFTGSNTRHIGRFEVADGATFFLDEIGELPMELQAKLLRVLQDGEFERIGSTRTMKVDVRIIAVTNRNLENEVRNGGFRADLFYRLNIFPIILPPLRNRIDDIPDLAYFYLKKISRRLGRKIETIPQNVMSDLQNYHWPGNIRELENVLERGVLNSSGTQLRLADALIKPSGDSITESGNSITTYNYSIGKRKTMQEVEREYIIQTLEQTRWKVSGKESAAEILGLERGTLRARMHKLDIIKS